MTHVAGHTADSPLSNQEYDDAVGGGGSDPSTGAATRVIGGRVKQWNPATSTYDIDLGPADAPTTPSAATYSGSGLPAGYSRGTDGLVYKQSGFGRVLATQAELDAINAPAAQAPRQGNPDLPAEQRFTASENEADRTFTAEQNEQSRAAAAAASAASIAQQQKQLDETIRANRVAAAQQDQNLDFLYDKFAVETDANNQTAIRDTQQMIWNAQRDKADIDYKYAGLQQEAAAFNAQQQFAVDLENQRRTEAQAERKRALAESIGVTAQDAGSRGKLAAQLLANPGLGELDTALAGGEDFFTEESLVPLTDLLGQRADAAKAPNFLAFNPISAPAAPNIPMPNYTMPTPQVAPTRPPSVTGTPAAGESPVAAQGLAGLSREQLQAGAGNQQISGPQENAADLATQLQQALEAAGYEDGGMAEGMYMGDEDGPELHIPLGPGEALVIPHDQVKNFLRNVAAPQMQGKKGMKQPMKGMKKGGRFKDGKAAPIAADMVGMGIGAMAGGGFFDEGSIFGTAQMNDQSGTLSFLAQALKRALSGTPWQQQGRAPTPIEVSAPGTDPLVQELGGSLSALGTGTPQDLFLRRARALRPVGISEAAGGVRRSA
ncbi:MAG: hypothetical protein NUW22_13930 [Acidobacteria bacterium]|nr:hypothetical protein [Acidobacteriota bacterium]